MKTRTKTLTLLSALVASAVIAGAQEQQRPEGPDRNPAAFKCPVCGRPCVNKAQESRVRRWQHHRRQVWQRIRADRRAFARQRFEGREQGPPQRFDRNGPMGYDRPRFDRQAQWNREPARAEGPRFRNPGEQGPPEGNAGPARRQLQRNSRRAMPFDINGDGKLSTAEKAARRAYRQAMRAEQTKGSAPQSQPPTE